MFHRFRILRFPPEKPVGQLADLFRFGLHQADIIPHFRFAQAVPVLQQLRIGEHGGEGRADIVGQGTDPGVFFLLHFLLLCGKLFFGCGQRIDPFSQFGQLVVTLKRNGGIHAAGLKRIHAPDDFQKIGHSLSQKKQKQDQKNDHGRRQAEVSQPDFQNGLTGSAQQDSQLRQPGVRHGFGSEVEKAEGEGGNGKGNQEKFQDFPCQASSFPGIRFLFSPHNTPFPRRF